MAGSRWVESVEAGMGQRHVLRSVKLVRVLASPTWRSPSLKSCRTIRDVKKRNRSATTSRPGPARRVLLWQRPVRPAGVSIVPCTTFASP